MILGMQIGMLIYGIMTLTSGKLTLSKTRVVSGPLARYLAFLLLAPVPLAYTAHGFLHADFATRGKKVGNDSTFRWTMIGVEAGITVLCLAIVYGVGFACAENPMKRKEDEAEGMAHWDVKPAEPRDFAVESSRQGNASPPVRAAESLDTRISDVSVLPTAILVAASTDVCVATRPSAATARRASKSEPTGPVCSACGAGIDLREGRRLPPWCVSCGKNL
jgi:hypothetical protein